MASNPTRNNFNLIASRRPPPLNIGYNEEGIEPLR
jgi:hypothetical protein